METFAQRIAKRRQRLGLTQKQVAAALDIPLSTYKEWEYGRRIQGEDIYVKLSVVLEMNLKELLTGEGNEIKMDHTKSVQRAVQQLNKVKELLVSLL